MAGHIQDRWYKTENDDNGKPRRVKTDRHGTGMRYRARYIGPEGITDHLPAVRDEIADVPDDGPVVAVCGRGAPTPSRIPPGRLPPVGVFPVRACPGTHERVGEVWHFRLIPARRLQHCPGRAHRSSR